MTKASTVGEEQARSDGIKLSIKKMSSDANKLLSSLFCIILACKETEKGTRPAGYSEKKRADPVKLIEWME
jgi:hypothetical protein